MTANDEAGESSPRKNKVGESIARKSPPSTSQSRDQITEGEQRVPGDREGREGLGVQEQDRQSAEDRIQRDRG